MLWLLRIPYIWVLAAYFRRKAIRANALGMEFDATGRRIGWRLLASLSRKSLEYLLHPIESVRYAEFAFVKDHLREDDYECLDVSSPRLFSIHVAGKSEMRIAMLNPDMDDIRETRQLVELLGAQAITLIQGDIGELNNVDAATRYDAIWSISVVEHIEGQHNDSDAMRLMFNALRPGGRLIVTVPVDREFRIEYSPVKQYGTQPLTENGSYFFQRFYDPDSIASRLGAPIGVPPSQTRWFGEVARGWWNGYRTKWDQRGFHYHVADPYEMCLNFKEFDSWRMMPGLGFCGLVFEKPQ
jgi:SAM-dependent methyltransferase